MLAELIVHLATAGAAALVQGAGVPILLTISRRVAGRNRWRKRPKEQRSGVVRPTCANAHAVSLGGIRYWKEQRLVERQVCQAAALAVRSLRRAELVVRRAGKQGYCVLEDRHGSRTDGWNDARRGQLAMRQVADRRCNQSPRPLCGNGVQ